MGQPWSAGRRMIEGRGELYLRSRAEANWARWLQFLRDRGDIREWWYEPCFFEFEAIRHGTTRYTPDFLVLHPDGTHHWEELKGWRKPKGETALKRMAQYHPEVELRVISWEQFRSVERSVAGLVPGWEFPEPEGLADAEGAAEDLGLASSFVEQVLAQGGTIEQLKQLPRGRRKR